MLRTFSRQKLSLLNRTVYTLLCLTILFIIGLIPLPGINEAVLNDLSQNNTLMMLSMFSGGNLHTLSILSIGLSTYITAQIIVQLLQANISSTITYWGKSGENGRRKTTLLTRIITFIFSVIQGTCVIYGLETMSFNHFLANNGFASYILLLSLLLAGSFFEIWMADRITEKGIGNGSSVIIATNIITQLPSYLSTWRDYLYSSGKIQTEHLLILASFVFILLTLINWFNNSEKHIPLQYSRREYFIKQRSYIPLKLLVPNVMPVIFASSILAVPQTLLLFSAQAGDESWYLLTQYLTSFNSGPGLCLYAALIFLFTYIYSYIQIDPGKLAESIQQQEAYVPGINPGDDTEQYIERILLYLALPGALFLITITVVPMVIALYLPHGEAFNISGTSLLIVGGTISEMIQQVRGIIEQNDFGPFLPREYKLRR